MQKELNIQEIFLPLDNYPNYEVSNYGNVRNKKTNKILKNFDTGKGYCKVELNGRKLLIHRLVALVFLPNPENKPCVDHIDNNKKNNELFNLRYATHQENNFNTKLSSNNVCGYKGIQFIKKLKKWRSVITINKQPIHLGYFSKIDDAITARRKKSHELFGQFINNCEK